MQRTWKRTVKAAVAEDRSAWTMILAYADEAFERDQTYANATAGRQIEQLRLELEAAGVSMAFDTLKSRAITGIHAHQATPEDRDLLTSVGWSIVALFAVRGYSPEASAHAIRQCIGEGNQPTHRWAQAFVRVSAHPDASGPKFSDDKLMKAVASVAHHQMASQTGEYAPSPMARLALQLLARMISGEQVVDWDRELADLVAAEGGG